MTNADPPSTKPPGREPLPPDRPKIVATAFAGWFAGVLPGILFGWWRGWFGVVAVSAYLAAALFVAFMSVKRERTAATDKPSRKEWLLAFCSATGEGTVTTLSALSLYGLGYGTGRLWNAVVVDFLRVRAPASPETIGFWIALPVSAVLGLAAVGMASEKLTRTLYPKTAGARSVYFPLLGQRARLVAFAAAAAVAVALTVASMFVAPGTWWAAFIPAAILVYVAMPLDDLDEGSRPREFALAAEAARVLRSAGYKVIERPQTGNPEVDPLIRNVSLLASSGDEAFAIELTGLDAKVPAEWRAASAVRTASTVLQQRMLVEGRSLSSVRPVLVVAGGTVAPSLRRFSEQEGVPVVQLDTAAALGAGEQRLIDSFRTAGIPFPAQVRS